MVNLLKYADFTTAEIKAVDSSQTKPFQHFAIKRLLAQHCRAPQQVGEIGCKTNFDTLLGLPTPFRYIIEPYNSAPGAGPASIPLLPYPVALFRCLVGPDSRIIPTDFFDCTFSISVIEHIGQAEAGYDCHPTDAPPSKQEALRDEFCRELFRITVPGGVTIHTVDHAARNLSFVSNFLSAGFALLSPGPLPIAAECLHNPDAVRQKTHWTKLDKPMPQSEQELHSVLIMAFKKQHAPVSTIRP